jgi:hypothetical protein
MTEHEQPQTDRQPDEPFDGFVFGTSLKAGTYDGRLVRLGRYTFEYEGQVVEKVRWTFEVETAEGIEEVTGSTSVAFTPDKATAFAWATSLLGRRPQPGEKVSEQILNKMCLVQVEIKESGWPKVAAVLPAKVSR